jgi:hypothetical protein
VNLHPVSARLIRSYAVIVRMGYRAAIVALAGGLAMAAVGGWLTGFLWLFWFVVANIGAQRFAGRLAKVWPIISAVILAAVVLGLRAVF